MESLKGNRLRGNGFGAREVCLLEQVFFFLFHIEMKELFLCGCSVVLLLLRKRCDSVSYSLLTSTDSICT